MDGLKLHGVLDALKKQPALARKILQHTQNSLTAEVVDNLFRIVCSEQGNVKREKEEGICFNFSNFLEEVSMKMEKQ